MRLEADAGVHQRGALTHGCDPERGCRELLEGRGCAGAVIGDREHQRGGAPEHDHVDPACPCVPPSVPDRLDGDSVELSGGGRRYCSPGPDLRDLDGSRASQLMRGVVHEGIREACGGGPFEIPGDRIHEGSVIAGKRGEHGLAKLASQPELGDSLDAGELGAQRLGVGKRTGDEPAEDTRVQDECDGHGRHRQAVREDGERGLEQQVRRDEGLRGVQSLRQEDIGGRLHEAQIHRGGRLQVAVVAESGQPRPRLREDADDVGSEHRIELSILDGGVATLEKQRRRRLEDLIDGIGQPGFGRVGGCFVAKEGVVGHGPDRRWAGRSRVSAARP
ncbi:hypothetical protein PSCLAVI8L_130445 [Pseudoclavibacter sp. 8L]|nr:hypothetical protein PSCLAVI8L_130445 [Pseudoclavibacter sp. 8L]